MKLLLFLIPVTLQLHAAWTLQTLSNASDGSLASRTVLNLERTLAAYRSGNALTVATSSGGPLISEMILANANPSNIFVSVGIRGAGLISYWDGTKYRFALEVKAGTGNCGPASNWQCGSVPLLPGAPTLLAGKIVGQADALGNAYFFAKARTPAGGANNGIYYLVRNGAGVWTVSQNLEPSILSTQSPVAIELATSSSIGFMAAGGGQATVGRMNSGVLSITFGNLPSSMETNGDMQKLVTPVEFCVSQDWSVGSGAPAGTANIRKVERNPNTGIWMGETPVLAPLEYATHHCSIQKKSQGEVNIAYTTDTGLLRLWKTNGPTETVDATSLFTKPILELTPTEKRLLLYQGPGYLKFAREQ